MADRRKKTDLRRRCFGLPLQRASASLQSSLETLEKSNTARFSGRAEPIGSSGMRSFAYREAEKTPRLACLYKARAAVYSVVNQQSARPVRVRTICANGKAT